LAPSQNISALDLCLNCGALVLPAKAFLSLMLDTDPKTRGPWMSGFAPRKLTDVGSKRAAPEPWLALRGFGAVEAVFVASTFTSALLLFFIEPMFTKMALPLLGGSTAVWSTAMVVFQFLMLAGYLYADLLSRRLPLRAALIVHVTLLALTVFALPIRLSTALGAAPIHGEAWWLVGLLLASIGLPFFALAGNGPLLQAWFSRTASAEKRNPYALYAASNLGSFVALIAYPALVEPSAGLNGQARIWTLGFLALALMIGACAVAAGAERNSGPAVRVMSPSAAPPRAKDILRWIALSAIPSGLIIAATAHISTDVAAAPLLWVIPLALFLLSFVLVFRDRPLVPMGLVASLVPLAGLGLAITGLGDQGNPLALLALHLAFAFLGVLVCNHRLFLTRPDPSHLTGFYLWLSVGGLLGGLFSGLLAPMLFNRVLEYPVLVVLVVWVAALEAQSPTGRMTRTAIGWAAAGGLLIFLGLRTAHALGAVGPEFGRFAALVIGLVGLVALLAFRRPVIIAALLPTLLIGADQVRVMQPGLEYGRSFYGVHRTEVWDGRDRVLFDGTTIHGATRLIDMSGPLGSIRPMPLTYYHPDGPMAETVRAVQGAAHARRLGVVGLGAGAIACDGRPSDDWSFYEIDASIARIATDPSKFRFLSACAPKARIVLGDARLTLAKTPERNFDYLLIDAFNSDSIPVHLMTREALDLYRSRLTPNGLLVLHITSRHLELESVVAALVRNSGLHAVIKRDKPPAAKTLDDRVGSVVVALSRSPKTLTPLSSKDGWRPLRDRGVQPWTDDFSNVFGALVRRTVDDLRAK